MQQSKNATLLQTNEANDNYRTASLRIDVAKAYEHKEIDTRWIELKLGGKLTSRSYFASCIQAGKVFIHGGYNEEKGILDDFVEAQFYDLPSSWNEMKIRSPKQKNPPPLRNHTICAFTSNLILFGGQKNMLENNSAFYKFDLRSNQWQQLKTKFQAEKNKKIHMALDSHVAKIWNNSMYIFGGYESEQGVYSNTLYEVSFKNLSVNEVLVKEVQIKGSLVPKPRGNFSACVVQNQLYIFGGTNSDVIFEDMWCYNFESQTWKQIVRPQLGELWPQKRKGHIMVCHQKSRTIFLFGGIREITKQQNDIMVFNVQKSKWIRIHKNTNELYQPSPTVKKQVQESPSIIDAKLRKNDKSKDEKRKKSPFKLGVKSVTVYNNTMTQSHNASLRYGKSLHTQYHTGFKSTKTLQPPKKHMSVVQQKKMREFLNRKKKLLNELNKTDLQSHNHNKRAHSPTSETIIYSLDTIGEQKKYSENFSEELPKVIFDQEKGALIGKKPCARDGHAGLCYDDNIVIIGGDRHMMSFNDVYLFKMDKALNSIHLYEE